MKKFGLSIMVICLACLAVCGIVVAPASATTQASGYAMARSPVVAPCVETVFTKRKSGPHCGANIHVEAFEDPPCTEAGFDNHSTCNSTILTTTDTRGDDASSTTKDDINIGPDACICCTQSCGFVGPPTIVMQETER